jgi:hemerythrin-like domain-containing protein
MMPIGPLMIEHRLIEKMIAAMGRELERMEREQTANPALIEAIVDFIRTYADRCHHGKEEDILFRELGHKNLSEEHRRIMQELVDEHVQARDKTRSLVEAKDLYMQGQSSALDRMAETMRFLVEFYPKHIEKEDRHFFLPVMRYFSPREKDAMIEEGDEFDRQLIHRKYEDVLRQVQKILGD